MRMSRRMTIGGTVKPLVLFDAALGGDQTAVTGGWSLTRANINASRIYVATSGGAGGIARPKNTVDITKYKYCHFTLSVAQSGGNISVRNAAQQPLRVLSPTSAGTYDIDISEYSGQAYAWINTNNSSGQVQATKIWFDNKPTELPALMALNMLTGMSGGNGNDEDALNIITGV